MRCPRVSRWPRAFRELPPPPLDWRLRGGMVHKSPCNLGFQARVAVVKCAGAARCVRRRRRRRATQRHFTRRPGRPREDTQVVLPATGPSDIKKDCACAVRLGKRCGRRRLAARGAGALCTCCARWRCGPAQQPPLKQADLTLGSAGWSQEAPGVRAPCRTSVVFAGGSSHQLQTMLVQDDYLPTKPTTRNAWTTPCCCSLHCLRCNSPAGAGHGGMRAATRCAARAAAAPACGSGPCARSGLIASCCQGRYDLLAGQQSSRGGVQALCPPQQSLGATRRLAACGPCRCVTPRPAQCCCCGFWASGSHLWPSPLA